jgi:transposase
MIIREYLRYKFISAYDILFDVRVGIGESYFGGRRKGKRGRGSKNRIALFCILERSGKSEGRDIKGC